MPKKQKSILYNLLAGFTTAVLFSAFIYFEHYLTSIKALNTIFALLSLAMFIHMPKKAVLTAGFFIGIFWFYWIGYSFKYQGIGYIAPFVTFGFGIIYMLFFGILAITDKPLFRAVLLFALSYFQPFDWNWLQIELVFVESYIGIFKYQLALVLLALSLPACMPKKYKFYPLFIILLAINLHMPKQENAPLKIKLIATDIKQEEKWLKKTLKPTILFSYNEIQKAINSNYDVIVFPESFFPLYMNENPKLIEQLLPLSKKITIIAGSLLLQNNKHYNVTYMFQNGTYKIAKKLVLVPFGEYIPLPKFAQKFINDTFFSGASDFFTADKPTDFIIKGVKFRNAICYEATCQEIYEGDVKFVIATSNNAWFAPSIEPTIQNLLLRYYGRKNNTTIYHSANYKGTGIIK